MTDKVIQGVTIDKPKSIQVQFIRYCKWGLSWWRSSHHKRNSDAVTWTESAVNRADWSNQCEWLPNHGYWFPFKMYYHDQSITDIWYCRDNTSATLSEPYNKSTTRKGIVCLNGQPDAVFPAAAEAETFLWSADFLGFVLDIVWDLTWISLSMLLTILMLNTSFYLLWALNRNRQINKNSRWFKCAPFVNAYYGIIVQDRSNLALCLTSMDLQV